MNRLLFVDMDRAYTSKAAMVKHVGEPVEDALLFHCQGELPTRLWRVVGGPEKILITDDFGRAMSEAAANADYIHSVQVMGEDDEPAPCEHVALLRPLSNSEYPSHLYE